jgi:hypothetical protein
MSKVGRRKFPFNKTQVAKFVTAICKVDEQLRKRGRQGIPIDEYIEDLKSQFFIEERELSQINCTWKLET